MRWLLLVLFLAARAHAASPLELVWYVHVGPLGAAGTYEDVIRERDALAGLARLAGARATFLIAGDVAEESLARKDTGGWLRLQREGHELGTLVAPIARLGTRSWRPGPASAGDQAGWVSQLIGADANREVEENAGLGQLGDPFALAGDASVFMSQDAVLRAVAQDGFRTYRFLTVASVAARPLWPEVVRFVRWAGRIAAPPPGGGARRARWATASGAHTALLAWQAYTKTGPVPVVVPDRTAIALATRDAHLAAITRLRAEHARVATTPANIEFRWWALTLWRRALASIDAAGTEAAFSKADQMRLATRLIDGPTPELARDLDQVFARMEIQARRPTASAGRRD